jgi:hypothetical protein
MLPTALRVLLDQMVDVIAPVQGDLPAETARRHRAIPLMADLGGMWMLKSDGSVWEVKWDSEDELSPIVADRRTLALAVGAKRYPWLATLLPTPPPESIACSTCKGEGAIRLSVSPSQGTLVCPDCQALGVASRLTRRCRRTDASVAALPLASAAERRYRWTDGERCPRRKM